MSSKIKKFGNWLDKKAAYLPPLSLVSSEEEKRERDAVVQKNQHSVMKALCAHYDIPFSLLAWKPLALNLAKDFVPAMSYAKLSGLRKDWGDRELFCLHILVTKAEEKRKAEMESKGIPYQSVFNEGLIERAKETRLRPLLEKNGASAKTLQNKHAEFLKSPHKTLFDKMSLMVDGFDKEAFYALWLEDDD